MFFMIFRIVILNSFSECYLCFNYFTTAMSIREKRDVSKEETSCTTTSTTTRYIHNLLLDRMKTKQPSTEILETEEQSKMSIQTMVRQRVLGLSVNIINQSIEHIPSKQSQVSSNYNYETRKLTTHDIIGRERLKEYQKQRLQQMIYTQRQREKNQLLQSVRHQENNLKSQERHQQKLIQREMKKLEEHEYTKKRVAQWVMKRNSKKNKFPMGTNEHIKQQENSHKKTDTINNKVPSVDYGIKECHLRQTMCSTGNDSTKVNTFSHLTETTNLEPNLNISFFNGTVNSSLTCNVFPATISSFTNEIQTSQSDISTQIPNATSSTLEGYSQQCTASFTESSASSPTVLKSPRPTVSETHTSDFLKTAQVIK